MATIKEVSALAKVSTATVSRVLNGHAYVKEANKQRVYEAMKALNFQPNASAQALASNKTNSIGMLVGSFDSPFYGPLMHHVEQQVREKNMHLIVTSGQESLQKEQDSIEFLLAKQVDGLVLHSDKLSDDTLISLLLRHPNTMIVNRLVPEIAESCIYINNEQGGMVATQFLIDNGHTEIACISGQMSKVDSRDRLQGYRNALGASGLPYNPMYVIEGRFDHQGNHDAVRRLLDRAPQITAIFCQNDNIALAVYDVCAERGITIGKELSVIGFDNDSHSQHVRPRLTTIDYPVHRIGEVAAKALLARIDNRKYSPSNSLVPELVERDSVCKLK
ncbi:LacI family DNA-binding transcriptional regulator [Vibrio breoganii]|uniref:LacI family DNA-binding transcriptional regulator n=1 Tax=Vibrio breoganii TaxID=553239 RepID=UPI0002F647C5|nr:LacI family DNA-binding transcriptional regulator [Vibrio breoganii]OED86871.1 LacI family transcriptional regulator [Vibrio breoganii ZF-55]PMO56097.1 LacI family transcriptional regulator [Vibrio breoganii]